MKLAHRHLGGEGKPPLVLLHGLLGSSRNWIATGKDLAARYSVFAVDLRNHGDSPHDDDVGFPALAADVLAFLDDHELDRVRLLGHSLGGKAAMRVAVDDPARVEALVVVDIAPKDYAPYRLRDFEAMAALPLKELSSRKDADERLAEAVPDWAYRQFLLTNLTRDPAGGFRWAVNLRALLEGMGDMRVNPLAPGETHAGPTTFILGGKSRFVQEEDHAAIRAHFPAARIETIPGAGHNPHMDAREAFLALVP